MIDAKVLSNAIKEYFISKIGNKEQMVEITEANADIHKIIDTLEADGVWCPVEHEVPSSDRYVLLSFENFTIPQNGRYEEDNDGGGAFFLGDDDVSLAKQGLFVNAWMELPKPYGAKEFAS